MARKQAEQLFPNIDFKRPRASTGNSIGGAALSGAVNSHTTAGGVHLYELPNKQPGRVNHPHNVAPTTTEMLDGRTKEEAQQEGVEHAPSTLPKQPHWTLQTPPEERVRIGSKAVPWEQRNAISPELVAPTPEQQFHTNLEAQQSE
jgi:hypothetical protein